MHGQSGGGSEVYRKEGFDSGPAGIEEGLDVIADGIAIGSKLHTHPLGVKEPVYRGVELILFEKSIQVVAQGSLELAA